MNTLFLSHLKKSFLCHQVIDNINDRFFSRHFSLFKLILQFIVKHKYTYLYASLPASNFALLKLLIITLFCYFRCQHLIFHCHRGDIFFYKSTFFKLFNIILNKKVRYIFLNEIFQSVFSIYYPKALTYVVQTMQK